MGKHLNIYNTIIYIEKDFLHNMVKRMDKKDTEQSKESSKDNNAETIFIRFNITGDTREMFLALKKLWNLRYNMETFRFMVKKCHDIEFGKDE
jgi:hypothetical protein